MADGAARAGVDAPLSPHLQIWRFTVTMASSITHRGTGVALYSGTLLLATWAFAISLGPASFYPIGGFMTSPFGIAILAGYTWALLFHAMNGIRHLYWDSGRGLNYQTARRTAWFVYIASFVLT
ncbi:MAG: succinate dehydrogenase, cytochrome b556 subunit, partial [Pseudomonadota bacterium]